MVELVRSYHQFCPAARALDVVGERWTLLVVRELLFGPKRYTDLQEGLPGIGPNVLAERLRTLEAAAVIAKRRLPPPAASTVYELTELGEALRPVLYDLFDWGMRLTGTPRRDDAIKASYWLPAIEQYARPEGLGADVDDRYEFRIGDEMVTVRVSAGRCEAHVGFADDSDVIVETDHRTFADLGAGRVSTERAIRDGRLRVEGDQAAVERCSILFELAGERATAATA